MDFLYLKKLNCALDLKRKPVGIRFIFSQEEYESNELKEINGKTAYCVMLKIAMTGKAFKASAPQFSCPGALRALGLAELSEFYTSGQNSYSLGLYNDIITAKDAKNNLVVCNHRTYGIEIRPLEDFEKNPDVVIMVTTPYNIMRIVQGYTYYYGTQTHFQMTGLQALCSECTAYPVEKNDINVSVLCGGTRYLSKWEESEMAVGMPYNIFDKISMGVYDTINAMEPNKDKKRIEERLLENGFDDLKIIYDKNYHTNLYNKK